MKINVKELLAKFHYPKEKDSYFISIEGIEGAGKTAQLSFIKSYLENKGFTVVILREPGGTDFGESLRESILKSKSTLTPLAEAYLFASARAQLLDEVTLKKLKNKKMIILCDRYIDSSIAYQGFAAGLGIETIFQIHSIPPLNILPNLTLYLKISVETSFQRMDKRNNKKDYFESKGGQFFQSLINGYDTVAQIQPERIKVINGEATQEVVSTLIKNELDLLVGVKC